MIFERLRPTRKQVLELAREETDRSSYAKFRHITCGPAYAVVLLIFITLAAIVMSPIHVVSTWREER